MGLCGCVQKPPIPGWSVFQQAHFRSLQEGDGAPSGLCQEWRGQRCSQLRGAFYRSLLCERPAEQGASSSSERKAGIKKEKNGAREIAWQ